MPRNPVLLILLATLLAPAGAAQAQEAGRQTLQVPAVDVGANFMERRAAMQEATRSKFGVPLDFAFEDRLTSSGITFRHESVDDSSKYWKPVHYDHGNGILGADVDGDSHIDLYFLSQLGPNELWRNRGDGSFENITERASVALADRVSVTGAFADVDNDGDQDLFVTTVRMGNVLYENDGQGNFTDVTKAAGVDYSGHSSGAVFLDYDLDGRLDLFVTNVGRYTFDEKGRGGAYVGMGDAFEGHLYPERSERSILYRNLGGMRFEDVSVKTGLVDDSWSGDATITDLNRDGYPDLYVLNMQGDDHYYENRKRRARSWSAPPSCSPRRRGGRWAIKFFDYDLDGNMDLMISDMHSDMAKKGFGPTGREELKVFVVDNPERSFPGVSNNILGNAFWVAASADQRVRGGSRTPLGTPRTTGRGGISVDDVNADGYDDVFVASSMNFPFRYGINTVLMNNLGERFLDAEFLVGVEPRREGRTHGPTFVLECSGADAEHERCQGLEGRVTILGALGTRSSIVFDLDGDGDLDIVTNEFNDVPQVLVSNLAEQRKLRYLAVRLVGTTSNRDGIGAWVTLHTDKGSQLRYQDATTGYLSHGTLPLYFGLAPDEKLERLEVRWPSGREQSVTRGLKTAGQIDVVEPSGE